MHIICCCILGKILCVAEAEKEIVAGIPGKLQIPIAVSADANITKSSLIMLTEKSCFMLISTWWGRPILQTASTGHADMEYVHKILGQRDGLPDRRRRPWQFSSTGEIRQQNWNKPQLTQWYLKNYFDLKIHNMIYFPPFTVVVMNLIRVSFAIHVFLEITKWRC